MSKAVVLTIELPSQRTQTAFNLRRWSELLRDPVLSPGNTDAEIREKTALCFNAGAQEVWHCSNSGAMRFFAVDSGQPLAVSRLCPEFPAETQLR